MESGGTGVSPSNNGFDALKVLDRYVELLGELLLRQPVRSTAFGNAPAYPAHDAIRLQRSHAATVGLGRSRKHQPIGYHFDSCRRRWVYESVASNRDGSISSAVAIRAIQSTEAALRWASTS